MNDEYISIKEFAKRANVSVQSLYKRLNGLNNPLNRFIKLVDNKKMLNIRALAEVYGIEVEQSIQPNHSTSDHLNEAVIEMLLNQSEILKRELEQKNEQLQEKDRQIREKDKQISEMQTQLSMNQKLIDQEQQLRMVTERKLPAIEQQMDKDNPDTKEEKKWWKFWRCK